MEIATPSPLVGPTLRPTETPGYLPVLARNPVRWLKTLVLPALGLPTNATRRIPATVTGPASTSWQAVIGPVRERFRSAAPRGGAGTVRCPEPGRWSGRPAVRDGSRRPGPSRESPIGLVGLPPRRSPAARCPPPLPARRAAAGQARSPIRIDRVRAAPE